jgi:glycosyltransferase involved in cell wall biosynthesis
MTGVRVSIVAPVYNEKENIEPLHHGLSETLNGLSYELVFVDDGSTDGSLEELIKLAEQDAEHVRVVEFRRNFGQTAAIAAGIDHSLGDVIVLIEADLQNDPADIPMMLEKIEEGFDMVYGWRVNRQDSFLTSTLPSRIAK